MKPTSIALPADLTAKIDQAARHADRSRSWIIRNILERAVGEVTGESRLADLEEIGRITMQRDEDRRAAPSKVCAK